MTSEQSKELTPTTRSTVSTSLGSIVTNFLKGIVAAGTLYFMGWANLSPAWLLIGVGMWVARRNFLQKKQIRMELNRAAVTDEKGCILATVEDLPAWVFFPDVERAEWVNKMLCQFWPYVGEYAKDLIVDTIEPSIKSFLPGYLQSFKFEKIELGYVPPRIGGVKVYKENVSRNEVIMDMELIYAGDCDFQIRVKGLKAGIKDLQVHGCVRVVLRPLVKQIPFVGGVTVFFLNPPAIDFNLTNIADVLDIPGINDILRKAVADQVGAMFVLPNKFSIPLLDNIPSQVLKYSIPCGVIRVQVVGAKDLIKADVGMLGLGKSDPYAIITVGAQEFRTQVIQNTLNPKWNFYLEAIVYQIPGLSMDIVVMDEDQSSKDDFLGRTSLQMSDLQSKVNSDLWLTLEDTKSGRIHVMTSWLSMSDKQEDLVEQMDVIKQISTKTHLSSAVLILFLDSAKHLPNASKAAAEPSPEIVFNLGSHMQKSTIKPNTNDPVWEEIFYFLLPNPEIQELDIKVKDSKSEKQIGYYTVRLSRLLREPDLKINEPITLLGTGQTSKLYVTLQLRILKSGTAKFGKSVVDHGGSHPDLISLDDSKSSKDLGREDSASVNSLKAAIPSLEDVVHSTVTPILDSVELSKDVLDTSSRDPSREVIGDPGAGKLQITLRYSMQRNKLIVVIHRAVNLPHKEGEDLPDPYVKVQLLPDKMKENAKKKTQVCRNTSNPVFDETFEFETGMNDLGICTLQITVKHSGSSVFTRGKVLGKTQVSLATLDLTKAITEWYELELET